MESGHYVQRFFPRAWPQGAEFEDAYRRNLAGQPLGFRALLVEVKGDWEFFGNVLHLPRWDNVAGICFLCKATKQDLLQNHLEANWRHPDFRLDHQGLLHQLRATKERLSPVWQFPLFKQVCLKLDWLHLADQGVTASFAGSILCLVVDPPGLPNFGSTIEVRTGTLWHLLQDFYKRQKMRSDKLKSLPTTRFRYKPPFLKAQAATVRKMVPWLVELLKFLDATIEEHRMVIAGMMALNECYKCLSNASFSADHLKNQAAIFGTNVANLHGLNPDRYALKPKMHLFQELCSQGIQPSQGWLYREEDFGGSLVSMAHKEGGIDTALSTSRTCLSRFCISAAPPSIVEHTMPGVLSSGAASSSAA